MTGRDGTRRTFLATAVAAVVGVAGCAADGLGSSVPGGDRNDDPGTTVGRSPTPRTTGGPTTAEPTSEPTDRPAFAVPPDESAVLDTFETFVDDWTVVSGEAERQSDRVYHGDGSVRLDSAGANRVRIERAFDEPRDLSGLDFSLAVRLIDTSKAALAPTVLLRDVHGNQRFLSGPVSSLAPDTWVRVDAGVHRDDGLDASAVESVAIGDWVGEREARFVVDDLQVREKPDTGLVAFTFDDSHERDYTLAYPTLSRYGFEGAFFPPIESVEEDSRPSLAEYREMEADGWDVGGHTLTHERLPDYPREEQRRILEENREQLRSKGFDRGADQFRTTRGSYDTDTLAVVHDYFDTCIVPQGQATGTAARLTDPSTIGYLGGDDYDRARDLVDAAVEHRQFLGLTLHMKHASDPHAFEALVEHARDLVDADDLRVVTPSEHYREYVEPNS